MTELTITRVFDAPRELVWAAFTERARLEHWWGPKGLTTRVTTLDLRPGGVLRYVMRTPDGHEMWGKWVYREVVPPERLVSIVSFTDDTGTVVRHPMSATWPLEMLSTMTLSEHHGRTTVTIVSVPHDATAVERQTFEAGHDSMRQGFAGTFDQLAAYFAGEATKAVDRALVITRVFDAPREAVFTAWTRPERVARWWGPHGFTNPVCDLDVRPGGAMRIEMRGPEGTTHPMGGTYRDIVEPERLVFTSAALDDKGRPLFEVLNTVTFAERGDQTVQTLRARVVTQTAGAGPYLAGMEAGWIQSLERLESHLTGATDREIVATRVFDAPRERVFAMWTDREHVARWWGPNGFTTTTHEMDVRPGGVWRFVMHGPDGVDHQNTIVYVEIVPPERLVSTHTGGAQFRMTATFAPLGDKTCLSARMLFDSAAERERVVRKFGAVEGLQQTLDRLGAYLASPPSRGVATAA